MSFAAPTVFAALPTWLNKQTNQKSTTHHALRQDGREGVVEGECRRRARLVGVSVEEAVPNVLQEGKRDPPPQRLQIHKKSRS